MFPVLGIEAGCEVPKAGSLEQTVAIQAESSARDPAQFMARFERAWAMRSPALLHDLLHAEVRLTQPLLPTRHGRVAALRSLRGMLALLPDLSIDVRHWAGDSQRAFIAFTLQGTLGFSTIRLPIIDDIRLVDGMIRERAAYFDPWPMLRALLVQPWLLWRLLRNPNAP